jgi:hypothetical protein
MSEKEVQIIIEKLANIELALYQLDEMGQMLLALILAGIVVYFCYYVLIRFTWF